MTSLLISHLLLASTLKVVVPPLQAGAGFSPPLAEALTEAVSAELRRFDDIDVLTYRDIQTILSHEQATELLGCANAECFADISKTLGARALLAGSASKLGTSLLLHLELIDAQDVKVVATADRRAKGGSMDDVLDALPAQVAELVEGAYGERKKDTRVRATPVAPVGTTPADALPAAFADVPYPNPEVRATLEWLSDGRGHYIALNPEGRYRGPAFGGLSQRVYAQRISGGGANGAAFDFVFWEPRVTERWRAQLSFRDGRYLLRCGEREITYAPVGAREKATLATSQLFDVRWQRQAVFIARDDVGNYYLVDRALSPANNGDYRLFVGPKGKLEHVPLNDAIVDGPGGIFVTNRGRFIVREAKKEAAWAVGRDEQPLTLLDLYQRAPFIYTDLGVYRDQPLGTLCDPHLSAGGG